MSAMHCFHCAGDCLPDHCERGMNCTPKSEPITLAFEATDISPSILSMLHGGDVVSEIRSPLSIIIETTDVVSGAPAYPALPTLDLPWWRVRKRRKVIQLREDLMRAWEIQYAAWVRDGKPDREIVVRRHLPNARIEIASD